RVRCVELASCGPTEFVFALDLAKCSCRALAVIDGQGRSTVQSQPCVLGSSQHPLVPKAVGLSLGLLRQLVTQGFALMLQLPIKSCSRGQRTDGSSGDGRCGSKAGHA